MTLETTSPPEDLVAAHAMILAEREVGGLSAKRRLAARRKCAATVLAELEPWLRLQHERVSRRSEIGKAIAYALKRWNALTEFMAAGRICLSNNAAKRAQRDVAVGRPNWTFAGSNRGERVATIYSLIITTKLNGIDLRAWLADVLARLPDHPAKQLDRLLSWAWA